MRVIMYTAVADARAASRLDLHSLLRSSRTRHAGLIAGWEATKHAVGENIHLVRSIHDPEWRGSRSCPDRRSSASGIGARTNTSSARARGPQSAGIPPRLDFRRLPQAHSGVHLPRAGMVAYALTKMPEAGFRDQRRRAYTRSLRRFSHRHQGHRRLRHDRRALGPRSPRSSTLPRPSSRWISIANGTRMLRQDRGVRRPRCHDGHRLHGHLLGARHQGASHSNLYEYLQSVQGNLSPSIAVLFAVGVSGARHRSRGPVGVQHWRDRRLRPSRGRPHLQGCNRRQRRTLKELKQQLYHGTITADQYAGFIAPIKQQYGLLFTLEDIHWLYWCQILFAVTSCS